MSAIRPFRMGMKWPSFRGTESENRGWALLFLLDTLILYGIPMFNLFTTKRDCCAAIL